MQIRNHVRFLQHYDKAKEGDYLNELAEAENWATHLDSFIEEIKQITWAFPFNEDAKNFLIDCWEHGEWLESVLDLTNNEQN